MGAYSTRRIHTCDLCSPNHASRGLSNGHYGRTVSDYVDSIGSVFALPWRTKKNSDEIFLSVSSANTAILLRVCVTLPVNRRISRVTIFVGLCRLPGFHRRRISAAHLLFNSTQSSQSQSHAGFLLIHKRYMSYAKKLQENFAFTCS